MPDPRLDVLCIGNAIVDVIADATDEFLAAEGLTKESLRLVDAEEATRLYGHMQPANSTVTISRLRVSSSRHRP